MLNLSLAKIPFGARSQRCHVRTTNQCSDRCSRSSDYLMKTKVSSRFTEVTDIQNRSLFNEDEG